MEQQTTDSISFLDRVGGCFCNTSALFPPSLAVSILLEGSLIFVYAAQMSFTLLCPFTNCSSINHYDLYLHALLSTAVAHRAATVCWLRISL